MNVSIVSDRAYNNAAYWHVVHEWEDVFAEYFELKFNRSNLEMFMRKHPLKFKHLVIGPRNFKNDGKEIKLCFVLDAKNYKLYTQKNNIPIFLDFPYFLIDRMIKATKKIPLFYVTCYDIYKEMLNRNCKNVRFIPLSISDKYYTEQIPSKIHDVIQFGRKNEVLHNYMLKYSNSHANVDYIYQKDGKKLTYYSTKNGDLGCFAGRKMYFELLAKCKVSLVSSPGIDGTRDFGGGIDFITPRFYESAVNYCYMLGRYAENEEAEMLKIASVCENIKSYEQFEKCLDEYLVSTSFLKKQEFEEFLKSNMTRVRCETIKNDIYKIESKLKGV